MKKLRITVFADPVCTWCWGSAPVLRALEYRLGDMVEIDYVMCGMIEDIRTFINRRLNIGGDAALSNRNMMKAWLEASVVHGMPVQEHGFHLFSDEYPSSFPQNMAYLTAKLCCRQDEHGEPDMKRVNRYLRRVQEATAAEAVMTSRADVLADLAAVEGYDPQDFAQTFASDAVKKAFIADRERARSYDVEAFPTFLLEYDGREAKLSGYTTFNAMVSEIATLSGGRLKPLLMGKGENAERCSLTVRNVKRFVEHYGSAYPVEIATAFGLVRRAGRTAVNIESYEQFPDVIDELLKSAEVGMAPKANSFMIYNLKDKKGFSQEREHELHHSWS